MATPKYKRNSGKYWQTSDKKQFIQLVRQNTPTRVISLKLGRTPEAVYKKASELNISLKPVNKSPYG